MGADAELRHLRELKHMVRCRLTSSWGFHWTSRRIVTIPRFCVVKREAVGGSRGLRLMRVCCWWGCYCY